MGFVGWLVTAQTTQGAISITSLTASPVILAGSLSALGAGALISIALSLISPADFDFQLTRSIGSVQVEPTSSAPVEDRDKDLEHEHAPQTPLDGALTAVDGGGRSALAAEDYAQGVAELEKSQTKSRIITGAFLLVLRKSTRSALQLISVVLVPAPLTGTAVIYPRGLFYLQCIAAAAFVFATTLAVIVVSRTFAFVQAEIR